MSKKGYQDIRGPRYQRKRLNKFFVMEEKSDFNDKCIPGFEKLWIWQKAYKLMQIIHKFYKTLPNEEKYKIKDQIERSSSSVCDNIAEGYSSYYYDDKIRGLNTARKEAGETQNHIRKLTGKGYIDSETCQKWINEYEEIVRGINGFIRYIRNKKKRC
ncbi:MAG: four helix bundle protein [candidate division WOR-3 bacterium]